MRSKIERSSACFALAALSLSYANFTVRFFCVAKAGFLAQCLIDPLWLQGQLPPPLSYTKERGTPFLKPPGSLQHLHQKFRHSRKQRRAHTWRVGVCLHSTTRIHFYAYMYTILGHVSQLVWCVYFALFVMSEDFKTFVTVYVGDACE
jgi:hypothetical protein